MSTVAPVANPSELLLGLTLPKSGWVVVEQLNTQGSSGGSFGTAYIVERNGEKAFLKALDFVGAINAADPFQAMRRLVEVAEFEREVHEYCTTKNLHRVIGYLGWEEFIPPAFGNDGNKRVFCLVLERGEHDLNKRLATINAPPLFWKLQVVRDLAQAVSQLHSENMAHQDIRPSNVIAMFDRPEDAQIKLGDLGRVVRKSGGPHNGMPWPGARQYAPPERYYGFRPTDWVDERESADAFMVGSIFMFLFTGTPMVAMLFRKLPPPLQPGTWAAGYDTTIRGALIDAQAQVIEQYLRPELPEYLADDVVDLVLDLTNIDPLKRGDKRARKINGRPVGMDRIFQRIQILALKAKLTKS